MEILLLAKIGMFIKMFVTSGYTLAGSYAVKTAIEYVKDYQAFSEFDKKQEGGDEK